MHKNREVIRAARSLESARRLYITSQVAALDLIELSEREATLLDQSAYRARRLADLIGASRLTDVEANRFYEAEKGLIEAVKAERSSKDQPPSLQQAKSGNRSESTVEAPTGEIVVPNIPETGGEFVQAFKLAIKVGKDVGLSAETVVGAVSKVSRLENERSRSELMLESLFISAVSQFEALILNVITTSLRFDPSPLRDSDRKFEFGDLIDLPDMASFLKVAVDAYADSLMRESMAKWMAFLARATRSDTTWMVESLEEFVMRRHVHVHFNGRVSQQYRDAFPKAKEARKLNESLPITREYLESALDAMAIVAVCLIQAGLIAIGNSSAAKSSGWDESDENIVEIVYDLLADGRNGAVAPLSNRLGGSLKLSKSKEYIRANSFHAKKVLFGLDSIKKDVEAWDVSSLAPELVLAKYCLLDDMRRAKPAFKALLKSGGLGVMQVATWPILEPFRSIDLESLASGRKGD